MQQFTGPIPTSEAVHKLHAYLRDKPDGTQFTWDELRAAAGDRDVQSDRFILTTVRNRLAKQGKVLYSIKGFGYKLAATTTKE